MVGKWNYEQVKVSFLSVKSTIKNELEGGGAAKRVLALNREC